MIEIMFLHLECAADIIKEPKEPYMNIALYQASVSVKMMLMVVCRRYNIAYTSEASIAVLFDKTYKYLPATMIELSKDICFWNTDLQYEAISIVNSDKALELGRKIQDYYNDYVGDYITELRRELHDLEASDTSTAGLLMKF